MITHKQQQYSTSSSQSGFTIVESLMAIVVAAILMTAIAPVIVLSVATRVQARRVEIASQAVRTYIDGIKSGAIAVPNHVFTPSPQLNLFWDGTNTPAAPTSSGSLSCPKPATPTPNNPYPYCSNASEASTSVLSLYCIDLDPPPIPPATTPTPGCSDTSSRDLIIQAFRSPNAIANKGYLLGLRVYRANAFNGNDSILKSDRTNKKTAATFTGGLGDRKAPLVEMTTEIKTDKTTFQDLRDRLGGS